MARNAERWRIDGEEMAMASESAMAWNASTHHDMLMGFAWTEKR